MLVILVFFVAHWQLSVFCQTFFLHRYCAHAQFAMSRGWERFFYVLTYACQGSSHLVPRAYAILHRMHHAYSDTERDPHSPRYYSNVFSMMWSTKQRYDDFAYKRVEPEARFAEGLPEIRWIDRFGQSWFSRLSWVLLYTSVYVLFAPSPWYYLLLPIHFVMGPVHGAIVNWCGHRYGYRNYDNGDDSKNTLLVDFVTLGELFQNNHHRFAMSPNFAARRFELDPTYPLMRVLHALGVIRITSPQRPRFPEVKAVAEGA